MDAANDLAQRLKHRSEQMLNILATEITGINAAEEPRFEKDTDITTDEIRGDNDRQPSSIEEERQRLEDE